MSIWIKAEMDRTSRRKCFSIYNVDAIDLLDIRVGIDTVDALADKLKAKGLIPKSAYLYCYAFEPMRGTHDLYFLDPSFPELKIGDMVTKDTIDVEKLK